MPDDRDVKKSEEAVLAVPGLLYVGPERAGRSEVSVGPAAGWMVPGGIAQWERELSFVPRAHLTPALASALRGTLPGDQIAARRYPMARKAVEETPFLALSSNLVHDAKAQGVRVHTVGVDRVSGDFFYFEEGGEGEGVREQGNLVEMLGPSLEASTTNAEIAGLLSGLIDRLLLALSKGVVSELAVELADALPRLSRDGTGLVGTDLDAFEAKAQAFATASSRWEAAAASLPAALAAAERKGERSTRVPLFGEARREARPALPLHVGGKPFTLPEVPLWTVVGPPREESRPVVAPVAAQAVPTPVAAKPAVARPAPSPAPAKPAASPAPAPVKPRVSPVPAKPIASPGAPRVAANPIQSPSAPRVSPQASAGVKPTPLRSSPIPPRPDVRDAGAPIPPAPQVPAVSVERAPAAPSAVIPDRIVPVTPIAAGPAPAPAAIAPTPAPVQASATAAEHAAPRSSAPTPVVAVPSIKPPPDEAPEPPRASVSEPAPATSRTAVTQPPRESRKQKKAKNKKKKGGRGASVAPPPRASSTVPAASARSSVPEPASSRNANTTPPTRHVAAAVAPEKKSSMTTIVVVVALLVLAAVAAMKLLH